MSDTVLYDQLLHLRLPAFREGLREQQANPKYAELSFEERLSLLVEAEFTQRQNNRIQRALHLAAFPMQAALEDMDFSPERGLDRRQILEWGQCTWIANGLNIWCWDQPVRGNLRRLFAGDRSRATRLFGALFPHLALVVQPGAGASGCLLLDLAALSGPHPTIDPRRLDAGMR